MMGTVAAAVEKLSGFKYEHILGGPDKHIMRRDPSPVIKVGEKYYVWYSRYDAREGLTDEPHHGYWASVWYATSEDGFTWEEQGEALPKGAAGTFDENGVFTPTIMVVDGCYYLIYTAVPVPFTNAAGQSSGTPTAIGMARASSPDGPWERLPEPIIRPGSGDDFDSHRTDDSCIVVRDGRYWLYYKGRQMGLGPNRTRMGLAIADKSEGPYVKQGMLVDGGHEVCVWPTTYGVAALFCAVGPEGKSLQTSEDGYKFKRIKEIKPPMAPGPYRADHYVDGAVMELTWGVSMIESEWDANGRTSMPYLVRFEAVYDD
jgi:hypothetical protein